jgi:hypothetical protein
MTQLTALNSRPGAGSSGGGGLVKPTNDHDQSPLISIYFENLFFFGGFFYKHHVLNLIVVSESQTARRPDSPRRRCLA